MRVLFTLLLACGASFPLHAQPQVVAPEPRESPAAALGEDGVLELETMVVSGVQPGPGLWKVRHGNHLLYVLGTQSPLPKGITWRSDEVTEVLKLADEVIGSPGVTVGSDIGILRGLTMVPSAMKAMKNPDGDKLQEVLPPELYARWSVLKQRYMGRDAGVEKKRPLIAVYELYGKALSKNGLRERGVIDPVISEALKARKMKRTPALLEIGVDDPRAALAEFRKETLKLEDLACFRKTLDLIENDLPQVAARANAWAVGDWTVLRSSVREEQQLACLSAWSNTETARKRGMIDIEQRVRAKWLATAEAALQKNMISFATLPVSQLVKPDGYLAALQAKGYTVEAPE